MSQATEDAHAPARTSLRDPVLAAVYVQKLINGIPAGIALAGIVLILFATTFPFAVQFPPGSILEIISHGFETNPFRHDRSGFIQDLLLNVGLFMPMGFGIAGMLKRAGRSVTVVLLGAAAVGLAMTVAVEAIQLGIATRDSSLSDIIANTLGAILGGLCWLTPANRLMDWGPTLLSDHVGRPDMRRLFAVLVIWCVGLLGFAIYLGDANGLQTWSSNLKIGLGDEFIDSRAWRGHVYGLAFSDQAVDPQQAQKLLEGSAPDEIFGKDLQAWYTLGPAGHLGLDGENAQEAHPDPIPDKANKLPPLQWKTSDYDPAKPGPQEHWLATPSAAKSLNTALARSGQFTVVTRFQTTDPAQIGDSRIITLSADAFIRNFSIMQEGHALEIRLRTGYSGHNGQKPVLIVPDVFNEPKPVTLVFTYADGVSTAYLSDRDEPLKVTTNPEGVMLWQLFPRTSWNLQMDQSPMRAHLIIFNLIAFTPVGILGGAIATLLRSKYRWRWLAIVAVVPALLLHTVFALTAWGGFRPVAIATSLVVVISSLMISYVYLTMWLRYAAARAAER